MSRHVWAMALGIGLAVASGDWAQTARAQETAEVSPTEQELQQAEDERLKEVAAAEEELAKETAAAQEEAAKEGKPEKAAETTAALQKKHRAKLVKLERKSAERRAAILAKVDPAGEASGKDKAAHAVLKLEQERQRELKKVEEEFTRESDKAREDAAKSNQPEKVQMLLAELEAKHDAKVVQIEQNFAEKRAMAMKRSGGHGKGGGKDKEKGGDDKGKGDDKGEGKGKGHDK